jgi:hypothetical protein
MLATGPGHLVTPVIWHLASARWHWHGPRSRISTAPPRGEVVGDAPAHRLPDRSSAPRPSRRTMRRPSGDVTIACRRSELAVAVERRWRRAAAGSRRRATATTVRSATSDVERPPGSSIAATAVARPPVVAPDLDRDDALARRGDTDVQGERSGDARAKAEAPHAGRGQHQRRELTLVQLAQPAYPRCLGPASERRRQAGTRRAGPPGARCSSRSVGPAPSQDAAAGRPCHRISLAVRQHERIARVLPRQHGGDVEPFRQDGRHVLGAVDREIHLLAQQRVLELLDEQPLAAHLGQGRSSCRRSPAGLHDHQLDLGGRALRAGRRPSGPARARAGCRASRACSAVTTASAEAASRDDRAARLTRRSAARRKSRLSASA